MDNSLQDVFEHKFPRTRDTCSAAFDRYESLSRAGYSFAHFALFSIYGDQIFRPAEDFQVSGVISGRQDVHLTMS